MNDEHTYKPAGVTAELFSSSLAQTLGREHEYEDSRRRSMDQQLRVRINPREMIKSRGNEIAVDITDLSTTQLLTDMPA